MDKRYLTCMAVAICAAALGLSGCTKTADQAVTVHGQEIPTLYKATGEERKITGWSTSTEKGKTLKYGTGDVLSYDVVSYLVYLQDHEGYIVVDGSDDKNDSEVEKKMAAAKDAGNGHYYYVSIDWNEDGETAISYQYAKGTVTLYDQDSAASSEPISEAAPYLQESSEDDTAGADSYDDNSSSSYSEVDASDYSDDTISASDGAEADDGGYEYDHYFDESNDIRDFASMGSIVRTHHGKYIIFGYGQHDPDGNVYDYAGMKCPSGTQSLDYQNNAALFNDGDIVKIYNYGYSGDEMSDFLDYLQGLGHGVDSGWAPSEEIPTDNSDGTYSDGGYAYHEGDVADTPIQSVVRLKDSPLKFMIIGTDGDGQYLGAMYPCGYIKDYAPSMTIFSDSDIEEVYWYGVSPDELQ